MILRIIMAGAALTLIAVMVIAVVSHSRERRVRRPGSADECRRQCHVAAKADRADGAMHGFMDAALSDVEGWTE